MNSVENSYSLTSGVVNSCIYLIGQIKKFEGEISRGNIKNFEELPASHDTIIKFMEQLNIISFEDGIARISKTYFSCSNDLMLYREIMRVYLMIYQPPFINRLKWGLEGATYGMDVNMKHCFNECKLLDFSQYNVFLWWYKLPFFGNDSKNSETGVLGELLTLHYERNILLQNAKMVSLKSSKKGYDIYSTNPLNNEKKFIEVKSSKGGASIFISQYEWSIAQKLENYLFYIWVIEKKEAHLFILPSSEMKEHIAQSSISGFGNFEICKIDFEALLKIRPTHSLSYKINSENNLETY